MRVFSTQGLRQSEAVFKFACSHWPNDDILVVDICFPYFAKNFRFPRTISYQDLPAVSPVGYKISEPAPLHESKPIELLLRLSGEVSARHVPSISDLTDLCSNASSVTFAGRLFYQPVMTFQLFVEHFTPHLAGKENAVLDFLHPGQSIEEVLAGSIEAGVTTKDPRFIASLDEAQVRRYFDFNYHLNANIILGDLYRHLSGEAAPVHLSKNMVLVLYLIRKLGSVERWGFEHIMRNWRGWKREGKSFEIGTIPSRQELVPNLVKLGLVKTEALESSIETVCASASGMEVMNTRDYHCLTDLGTRFLECLHPDCYDPFLPRRLDKWQQDGIKAARPQIDRYIKTYFGKQIRFQSKLFRL